MPITTSDELLQEFVGSNVGTGDLGRPEVPDTWGAENGGYINDYPDDTWGGMTSDHGIYRVFPWWAMVCDKTYNPEGSNCLVQLKAMRHHRRKNTKTWTLLDSATDPRGGAMDYLFSNGPVGETNAVIPSSRIKTPSSGGVAFEMANDFTIHGYPLNMYSPDYSNDDCLVVTMLARVIPKDPTQEFLPDDFKASLYLGQDNYGSGWIAEHSHGRFKKFTAKWQVYGCGTVKRPSWSNQGPGLTTAQYTANPSPLPPEEGIWLERGAYNSGTNKQTLVIKRTAPPSSNKSYTLSVTRGTASAVPASVVMTAGQSSVQFDVTTPGSLPTSQQIIYATDGAGEDHWFGYTFGNGTSTGDSSPKTLGNLTMVGDSLFRGNSVTPYYSPAQELQSLLSAGGYTVTFVGDQSAYPGSIPVCANGGRKISDIDSDISNVDAQSPDTVIISIGTNDSGVTAAATCGTQMTDYLNNLETALGAGKLYYVFAPNDVSWFDGPTFTAIYNAMQTWCSTRSNATFGNLTDSGVGDGDVDGTHWVESEANDVAAYIYGIIEGSGVSPGTPDGDQSRTNLIFQSGSIGTSPWDLKSGTAGTADGDGWQLYTGGTDYLQQAVAGFSANAAATVSVDVLPGTANWVQIRMTSDDFGSGIHQFVNVSTGDIGTTNLHGSASDNTCTATAISGGGYRIRLTVTLGTTTRQVLIKAASANEVWTWETGLTVKLRRWQAQAGIKGTNPIPTTTAAVTRTLTTATVTATTALPVSPAQTGTITLIDNASAAWDRFSDNHISSSAPTVVSVTQPSGETDDSGQVSFTYTPLANGSANLTALSGAVSSSPVGITVSGTEVTLDAPGAPTVGVSNSDTVSVNVGSIDTDATSVVIEASVSTGPTAGVYLPLTTVLKSALPVVITGLHPGTAYSFRARVTLGALSSVAGTATSATTKGLFVEGYVSTRALSATGVKVQIFRPAPSGDGLPLGESIGYFTGQAFSAAAVVVGGIQQAPIRVTLTAQPTTGKIRNGDRMSMVALLPSPRKSTQPMDNAVVIEV